MTPSPRVPRASQTAERFVKHLNVAYKAVRLYPPSSAIPRESASTALATLRLMLRDDPDVSLTVTKEGLFHDDGLIHPGQEAFDEFAREFFGRRLAEVRFHSGVITTELIDFLRILDMPKPELLSSGGFEARLWDAGVVNITVREASTRIVDHAGPEQAEAPDEEASLDVIDEILSAFSSARPRDQVVLVRVIESPEALGAYLKETVKGRGTTPPATWMTSRVSALAHAVTSMDPDSRLERLQAVADALMGLDEETLRDVLADRMLSEARHDDVLAEVVRRLGVERLCRVLAAGLEDTDDSREGLTRAFRNLIHISDSTREEVMGAAAGAMESVAVDPGVADAVLQGAVPSQVTVRESKREVEASPLEKIVRLVDHAPGGKTIETDEAVEALRAESREGISDGDVLDALVTLVSIEYRDERFGSLMSMVEDSLDLLVLRQEYHVASAVADSLTEAAESPDRPGPQRIRIRGALDSLAGKANMRAIATAMRRFPADTPEHTACRHLLSVLGRHAVGPLLEVLADEPDMTARKAIVELASETAEEHLEELGTRLADDRWYFVRNVVTIVGSTRTPETLPLLGRTLRYPDPRVRRETIRAVSCIKDALAGEMLVAALEDPDAQNVQLAARYLGLTGIRTAAGALEAVAAGRGDGNRDIPARIEAVEALGRLRSTESLQMLRGLTRTRGIRGRARVREMGAAVEAAVRAIESGRPAAREGVEE